MKQKYKVCVHYQTYDGYMGFDDWTDSPKAYCLDVGVLDTGETALIEINDAFSCGSYSMSAETYGDLLTTRWDELKG